MKHRVKKLDSKGLAHLALPLLVIVAIACIGTYLLVKSKAASYNCTSQLPEVKISNTYEWATDGSWGTPGQSRVYAVTLTNNDCQQATYDVTAKVPDGFTAKLDKTQVSLDAYGSGKFIPSVAGTLTVTSSSGATDGAYPVSVTMQNPNKPSMTATGSSYYRVYSTDTTQPQIGITSPNDTVSPMKNALISGSTHDEHAVKTFEVYLDGHLLKSQDCSQEITYACNMYTYWDSTKGIGNHTLLYKSTDMFGNATTKTVGFTVSRK